MKPKNGEVWIVKVDPDGYCSWPDGEKVFDLVFINKEIGSFDNLIIIDTNDKGVDLGSSYCSNLVIKFIERVKDAEIY